MPESPKPGLPPNVYVTAAFAKSINRTVIIRWTAIVFICIASLGFLWCVICRFIYGSRDRVPNLSAFPLLDFAMVFPPDTKEGLSQLQGWASCRDRFWKVKLQLKQNNGNTGDAEPDERRALLDAQEDPTGP